MTALSLFLWICAGILFQVAIFLGIGFWRHWQKFLALSSGTVGASQVDAVDGQADVEDLYVAAWQGYRAFRVDHRVIEDAAQSVCSFYLVPEDGQALPSFLPGQFLTFRLDLPTQAGGSEQIIRCYSLSDAPGRDRYRVSIKRVPAPSGSLVPPGRSSNHFHDQVGVGDLLQIRAPAGHFHIDREHCTSSPDRWRHWHYADVEHGELVPDRTAGTRNLAVLWRASWPGTGHAGASGKPGHSPSEFPSAPMLQQPTARRHRPTVPSITTAGLMLRCYARSYPSSPITSIFAVRRQCWKVWCPDWKIGGCLNRASISKLSAPHRSSARSRPLSKIRKRLAQAQRAVSSSPSLSPANRFPGKPRPAVCSTSPKPTASRSAPDAAQAAVAVARQLSGKARWPTVSRRNSIRNPEPACSVSVRPRPT